MSSRCVRRPSSSSSVIVVEFTNHCKNFLQIDMYFIGHSSPFVFSCLPTLSKLDELMSSRCVRRPSSSSSSLILFDCLLNGNCDFPLNLNSQITVKTANFLQIDMHFIGHSSPFVFSCLPPLSNLDSKLPPCLNWSIARGFGYGLLWCVRSWSYTNFDQCCLLHLRFLPSLFWLM